MNRIRTVALAGICFATCILLAGCGDTPSVPAKSSLDAAEVKQVQDLNEQRAVEWSGTKKPAK